MDIQAIKEQTQKAVTELVERANLSANDLFVLGISTSEVQGKHIGKHSSQEIGDAIIETLLSVLKPKGIFLAVQGCEHINRALTLEREAAALYGLEEVSVVPAPDAGGAGSVAAYKMAEDPIVVEHIVAKAGMDIGDTAIGMHVKHVQIPVRLEVKAIGEAHLTALSSRPKKIGGPRAHYTTDHIQ